MKKKAVLVKTLLVVLLLSIIAGLTLVYYLKGIRSGSIAVNHIKVDASADLVMKTMKQTSTRNGIKEWALEASSARLLKKSNKAEMENVKVSFYLENNDIVFLRSKKGVLDTDKKDMTFTGHVVVTLNDNILQTDKLHYEKKRHIIYTDSRVKLENKDAVIYGNYLETDLNNNCTTIRGDVKGFFSERFNFF